MNPTFERILLTGAAGALGKALRAPLAQWTRHLRLSDVAPLDTAAGAGEEIVPADLADAAAVDTMTRDVEVIVHMGGISTEQPFDEILDANIRGVFNLYDAARRNGVRRIVFASSNHATGFYPVTDVIDADAPVRPDSLYGVSKCFGEALSRYYFDRFGLETVCLRIGSAVPTPLNQRMLSTFLSYADLTELVRCALFAPRVDHTIVYGVSDNVSLWWDNTQAAHLGYRPRDNAAALITPERAREPVAGAGSPAVRYQGGTFVLTEPAATRRKE